VPTADFRTKIERQLGRSLQPAEWAVLSLRHSETYKEAAGDPLRQRDTVEIAVELAQDLSKARWSPQDSYTPQSLPPDTRWQLLADLDAAYKARAGQGVTSRFSPLRIEGFALDLGVWPPAVFANVWFDSRLSHRALAATLRREWPELRRRGYVRQTRPLGSRTISLVRFVCLETEPATTWRDRLKKWRARFPTSWPYKDARAFESAFRRAEVALTGQKYGFEELTHGGLTRTVLEMAKVVGDFNQMMQRIAERSAEEAQKEEGGQS